MEWRQDFIDNPRGPLLGKQTEAHGPQNSEDSCPPLLAGVGGPGRRAAVAFWECGVSTESRKTDLVRRPDVTTSSVI